MDVPDGEDLTEVYLGKKKAVEGKGNLARIIESYQNSEEEEGDQLRSSAADMNTLESEAPLLPKMSPAMSYKSLQQPSLAGPAYSRLNETPFRDGCILPAMPKASDG